MIKEWNDWKFFRKNPVVKLITFFEFFLKLFCPKKVLLMCVFEMNSEKKLSQNTAPKNDIAFWLWNTRKGWDIIFTGFLRPQLCSVVCYRSSFTVSIATAFPLCRYIVAREDPRNKSVNSKRSYPRRVFLLPCHCSRLWLAVEIFCRFSVAWRKMPEWRRTGH